jgi:hypothetical protein
MRPFALGIIFLCIQAFAQDSSKTVTTIFYFGGSDCHFCVDRRNVQNINKMKGELPQHYHEMSFKFVLVVMDKEIDRGIRYSKKYPGWDEVCIGQFYDNELMLEHVNRSAMPGVPHIMVYRDSLRIGKWNIPTISNRALLVDLAGEGAIDRWVQSGYALKK